MMILIKLIFGICGIIGGYVGEGLNLLDIVKFILVYVMLICKIIIVKSNKIVVGCDVCIFGEMVKNVVCGILMGMGFDVVNIGLVFILIIELVVIMEGVCGGIILIVSYNFR